MLVYDALQPSAGKGIRKNNSFYAAVPFCLALEDCIYNFVSAVAYMYVSKSASHHSAMLFYFSFCFFGQDVNNVCINFALVWSI